MSSLRHLIRLAPKPVPGHVRASINRSYATTTQATAATASPQTPPAASSNSRPRTTTNNGAAKPIARNTSSKPAAKNGNGNAQAPIELYKAPTYTASSESAVSVADVDWATSYYGVGTKPVTEEQYKILMKPLETEDVEVKPDGIIYLPEIKYRRRLNEAFGPMGWGLIPRGEPVVGQTIVTREYAMIVNGRFVSQAQGENQYFSTDGLPSAVEGCKSNALMRCCKDLGIASDLWDPTFIRSFRAKHMEERWVEHTVTKKKRPMWFKKDDPVIPYPYKKS